jgi:hypothetical protein
MLVLLAADQVKEARQETSSGLCSCNNEECAIHNNFAQVQVAFILLLHDIVKEIAVISLGFHALENLLSAIVKVLLSSLGDTRWDTPLQKTLQWTSSGADTSGSLFDSPCLDRFTDEWNPETKIL